MVWGPFGVCWVMRLRDDRVISLPPVAILEKGRNQPDIGARMITYIGSRIAQGSVRKFGCSINWPHVCHGVSRRDLTPLGVWGLLSEEKSSSSSTHARAAAASTSLTVWTASSGLVATR